MENKVWIRRDRDTGKQTEVDELFVKNMFHGKGIYIDLKLAMKHASEKMPMTNGFADYWPKA